MNHEFHIRSTIKSRVTNNFRSFRRKFSTPVDRFDFPKGPENSRQQIESKDKRKTNQKIQIETFFQSSTKNFDRSTI